MASIIKRSIILAAVIIAIGAAVGAQSTRPAALDDVVNEIRALRADLNQTASVTVRTQLLVARLQLQEQRIAAISKQLNDAQTQLEAVRNANSMTVAHLKQREEAMPRMSAEDRQAFEAELKGMKPVMDANRRREQMLTAQANELTGLLAAEQSRWSDFNERIDALERSLPGR